MAGAEQKRIIEVDSFQKFKRDRLICGDTFYSIRLRDQGRTISILSDGLGSGVKANVLSTLTAVMAARFTAGYMDPRKSAEIIMRTLPICKERKISYATFTILDVDKSGAVSIVEYDNPSFLLIRDREPVEVETVTQEGRIGRKRRYSLRYSRFQMTCGDRLVCFSDGVTQSGIGRSKYPVGWGAENALKFVLEAVRATPEISAREISRRVVAQALVNDGGSASDDITCGVVYFRKPRELLIVSGPPYDKGKDRELARRFESHCGAKIICGGTTAKIISRELDRSITLDFSNLGLDEPPPSVMDGVDLVTEGIITLSRLSEMLKSGADLQASDNSPARRIFDMMLNSDIIRLIVGTRINEAYQDPDLPDEIALRKSIIRDIVRHLEEKYLKETEHCYI